MSAGKLPDRLTLELVKARISDNIKGTLDRNSDLNDLLGSVESLGGSWAMVGGAPRYWTLGGPEEPHDLDIVVDLQPKRLKCLISDWTAARCDRVDVAMTSFGGYRLSTPAGLVDLWSTSETVGILKGRVGKSRKFRAVARSAALSLDSLVATSNGQVFECGFLDTVNSGILHLNHDRVERRDRVAAKAIRLCRDYNLAPDIAVQAFVCDVLRERNSEAGQSLRTSSQIFQDR